MNKIIIGHFEQAVSYEGIHNLCFSCGRLGHKVEACSYTICKEEEQVVSLEGEHDGRADPLREEHDTQRATASNVTPVMSEATNAEGVYGLWMVVKRNFNGHKGTKSSVGTESTTKIVWNSSLEPIPIILEWMGTPPSGPMFTQSMPYKGVK